MQTKKVVTNNSWQLFKERVKNYLFLKYNDEWEIPKFGKVCTSLFALQTPKKVLFCFKKNAPKTFWRVIDNVNY